MPKTSLQDLGKYPYTMNDHTLVYLPKSISLVSTTPCFETQRQVLKYFYKSMFAKRQEDQSTREIIISKKLIEEFEILIKKHGENDIDKIWDKIFPTLPKSFSLQDSFVIKESQLKEFYISVLFSLMDPKIDNIDDSKNVFVKVFRETKNEDNEFARYIIHSDRINIPQVSYKYLFQKLSIGNIIQIFKCILIERQIIFFSSTPGDIPFIGEALLSFLGPL